MLATDVLSFVRATLPAPPARILEVGAGAGELAAALGDAGYDVLAIDPAGGNGVVPVALHELEAGDESFDAAVAVLSLHHVEPLSESCGRLAQVVRRGGVLAVDEFDVARFDERAAAWWIAQRRAAGGEAPDDPAEMVGDLRHHLHPVARVREALAPWFDVGEPVRGAYLHRWYLHSGLREVEESAIAAGDLPATGARLVATRSR
jgi:SAM-dependent methyltransferase